MKTIKVGIDGREFEKDKITGIGKYLKDFIGYASNIQQDWEFIIFCNQFSEFNFDAPNIKTIVIKETLTPLWDQVLLPRFAEHEKIDIFISPYFKAPLFIKAKLLLILNDIAPMKLKKRKKFSSFLSKTYFSFLASLTVRKASVIVTISESCKKDIAETFNIEAEKIRVVYLGIDKRYKPLAAGVSTQNGRMNTDNDRQAQSPVPTLSIQNGITNLPAANDATNLKSVLSKYGINSKYILYVGRFLPHKNVGNLVISYSQLPKKTRDSYSLVLGGSKTGEYFTLLEIVDKFKLQKNVIFTGFISEEDLPYLYSAAEIFIFPSLFEGFGLPVLEAMACGTPVITSNSTSLPEVVGDAGMLVNTEKSEDIFSAIMRIISDEEFRKELVTKGIQRANLFSVEKMTKGLLSVIESVL